MRKRERTCWLCVWCLCWIVIIMNRRAGRRAGGSALLYFSSTRALMHFPIYSIHSTGWLWMRTTCLVGGYFSTITTWRDSPKSSILQVATRRRSKQNINNIPLSVDSFPIQLFLLFDLGWPFVRLLRLGYDSRFTAARQNFNRGAPFSSFLKKKKKKIKKLKDICAPFNTCRQLADLFGFFFFFFFQIQWFNRIGNQKVGRRSIESVVLFLMNNPLRQEDQWSTWLCTVIIRRHGSHAAYTPPASASFS